LARWPEGSLQPFVVSEPVTMDARAASEEGSFQPPRSAASYCEARGSAFALGCPAHVSSLSPLSCSVTLATGGRIVASPASGVTRTVAFDALNFGELAAPRESASMEWMWLAARSAQKAALPACRALRKRCAGSGSKRTRGSVRKGPGPRRARVGRSRVALARHCRQLQKSIGGVGLRDVCAPHFTRFGGCTRTGV